MLNFKLSRTYDSEFISWYPCLSVRVLTVWRNKMGETFHHRCLKRCYNEDGHCLHFSHQLNINHNCKVGEGPLNGNFIKHKLCSPDHSVWGNSIELLWEHTRYFLGSVLLRNSTVWHNLQNDTLLWVLLCSRGPYWTRINHNQQELLTVKP